MSAQCQYRGLWRQGQGRQCRQTVAVRRWEDDYGHERAACPTHRAELERRYPPKVAA